MVFAFSSFNDWVNGASRIWRFHEIRSADTLCVDAKGRVCTIGKHFMVARDEDAFPIGVYRLRSN